MANNPGTNSAANLLSLPPQIMEAVANKLPQEDLPSLRLVCRDINSKITRSFEQRCIADKRVVVGSPRSMQNLENLSNHPRFGNILQRITLVLQDLHYSPLEPGLKRWASEIRSDKATVSIEHRAEYSRLRQVYHGMILQQKKFAEGSTGDANGWNRVLARSLKNLEARNTNGLAITATCQRQQHALVPREFETFQRTIGFDVDLRELEHPDHDAVRTLHAIFESQCSVSELALPDSS